MPVIKNYSELPGWSEVKFYEIINLKPNYIKGIQKKYSKEAVFILDGNCSINCNMDKRILNESEHCEFDESINNYSIQTADKVSRVVRVSGNWGKECGGRGVFTMNNSEMPKNIGDPSQFDNIRKTDFDNHYHDCDELWIIAEGAGKIVTEENLFEINGECCVITKAVVHHDMIDIYEEIKGLYFETSLKGLKREGHLWNHTHKKGVRENEL